MNKDLLDSMRKQMAPGPEVRAALDERLARPVKRRISVRKYAAVAACAALVIGAFSLYNLYRDEARWMLITQNFNRGAQLYRPHSYVMVDDSATAATGTYFTEGSIEDLRLPDGPNRDSGAPNSGDLPSVDVPVQEGVEDYQALMDHFNGTLPDWYGGAYLDADGYLVVLLVESRDPGDKSLELQVREWTGSDNVRFGSAKYSLNHLNDLMDRLNRLPEANMKYSDVMSAWGIYEDRNRIELTLTQVYEPILSDILFDLADLDPEDDAIYVKIGQRAAVYAGVEDDENLIADEPWVDDPDFARRDAEPQQKRTAAVQSVPEEEDPRAAATYDPKTGTVTVHPYPHGDNLAGDVSGGTAAFDPGA